jgi:flagellar hook assembly protein FlgD
MVQSMKIFPNPFSSSTMIEYEIENTATVNLSVYNHLGQRVAVLLNERQGAGKHTVAWDAKGLPEGIYYCRLQVGDEIGTGKLILMK